MDVGMLRQAGEPVEDQVFRYFRAAVVRPELGKAAHTRRGGRCRQAKRKRRQTSLCLANTSSGVEDGARDGPQDGRATSWSGHGWMAKSVEPQDQETQRGQARPGQAKDWHLEKTGEQTSQISKRERK